MNARNKEDENYLKIIGKTKTNMSNSKLAIYDARAYVNALANRVTQGGFENKEYY